MEEILNIYGVVLNYWWIIVPVVLFFILRKIWLNYIIDKFVQNIEWTILEIKFPQEAVKSPKAMEQFFNGLHAVQKRLKFKDKYIKGEIPPWFSIEVIGREGGINIFFKTPTKFRNLVESQIYAQYPDAEISETEDYINILPKDVPNDDYDIWGTEIILNKPDAYPIRTYPIFFEEREIEERTDPIAGLFEFLSSLKPQEHAWIQILISPTDDKWKKEGEELLEKLLGREVKRTKGGLILEETKSWIEEFANGIREFFYGPAAKSEEKKTLENLLVNLSPGEREVIIAIEKNIAKLGFKTIIRELYWTKKDEFFKDKTAAVGGFFKQFNTQNLNGFKPNKKISPGWAKIFKKRREPGQKRYLINIYKKRYFPYSSFSRRGFVFSTEELATIFHIPIKFVKVERMPKIEAKKGGPPTELPTE